MSYKFVKFLQQKIIEIIYHRLTLSDPSYFRQLTIRGGGFKSPPPPLRSRKLLCQSSPYYPGKKWVTYYVQVSTSFLKICTYL